MSPVSSPLTDLYTPIRDEFAVVERIFDEEIAGDLDFINGLCDTVRSYRGKMLRPAMLLLAGKATGELSNAHRTLAAVVEMVHMATLVHDDVLDEAVERRRRPTIASIAGNTAAVLLGDYLISHAFHLCSRLKSQYASRRIGATTNTVCEGELLQNHHRGDLELTENIYFEIIRRKTGALTAVSAELGGKLAGAGDGLVRSLYAYGMSAGVAFQIIDDVLDIVGDESRVGKTLGLDLTGGNLTLPVIHGLAHADRSTAAALRDLLGRARPGGTEHLRALLEQTQSIAYAVETARRSVEDAVSQLDLVPHSDAKQSLVAMAEFIVARQF
ncbi:MAG: polyprenyl synthetase family protein, partial [Planctomycetota bacterium]